MRKLHFPKKLRDKLIHKTSRDHARMPIPWTTDGGFSMGKPWIQMNQRMGNENVTDQMKNPHSIWSQTRSLIQIRKEYPELSYGDFNVIYAKKGLFIYERILESEKINVLINLTPKKRRISFKIEDKIIWENQNYEP